MAVLWDNGPRVIIYLWVNELMSHTASVYTFWISSQKVVLINICKTRSIKYSMTIILHMCNSNKSCVIVMKSLSIKNAIGII